MVYTLLSKRRSKRFYLHGVIAVDRIILLKTGGFVSNKGI